MLRRVLDRESLVKSNLTDCLVDCVKELQLRYAAERGSSLTNDESTNTLCWTLEAIFIHGLKNPFLKSMSSVLGSSSRENQLPDPSFWEFVLIFCHQEVIVHINGLSHIHTDIGRCRAWLRVVLNDGLLISYIQLMLSDKRTLKDYYKPSAFLRDGERCDIMKSYLYGIESYDFQLASNSSLLNSWNSGPLSLVGLWSPADTIMQGIDVAENMDAKDLQALPNLRSQSNTPPKSSYFPHESAYRTPLLEEDEALRVILSSRGSATSSAPRSSSASSRRNSDQHSPLSSLPTIAPMPEPPVVSTTSNAEPEVKKSQTRSHVFDQNGKNEAKGADKTAKAMKRNKIGSVLVSQSAVVSEDATPRSNFASSTPKDSDPLSDTGFLKELSARETVISTSPISIPIIPPTPEEDSSYAALFHSYNKSDSVIGTPITIGSFLDSSHFRLSVEEQNETTVSSDPALGSSIETSLTPVDSCGFEIVSHEEITEGGQNSELLKHDCFQRISNEVGLDEQNYKCKECEKPIGMIYGAARVCGFSGHYYCTNCHVNDECVIPVRILLNWDFTRYNVCKKAMEDLQSAWDQPILNFNEINRKLYKEVQECADLLVMRTKLQSISIYLRTCKQPIMTEFIRDVWPKEYLYEEIHLYSLSDLLNIPNRSLLSTLAKLVDLGKSHIKSCEFCQQKGFVCEICRDPKVIFPFDLETIFKCSSCGAVYHNKCMNHIIPCPRCVRWKVSSFDDEELDSLYSASIIKTIGESA